MVLLPVVLLLILIALATIYFLQFRKRFQYFSDRGIPTPPYEFFFGHLRTLWKAPLFYRQLEAWTKQYGKIYGVYEGSIPLLIVSDPEFLQEVFVKQFHIFHSRRRNPLFGGSVSVFTARGDQWRRHRQIINPTFSPAKVKLMSPLMNESVKICIEKLAEASESGNEFDICPYFKKLTSDFLFRCAIGIDTDLQNNPDNLYFKKLEAGLSKKVRTETVFVLSELLPEFTGLFRVWFMALSLVRTFINMRVLPLITKKQFEERPTMWIMNRLGPLLDNRLKTPTSRVDLLQLLIKVMTNETVKDTARDDHKPQHQLTRIEVLSNIMVFIIAGFESSSPGFLYIIYALAKYPEAQEKLQAEVDQLLLDYADESNEEEKKDVNYEAVAKMPYMDQFIAEVMRMYPISDSAISREAAEDTVVKGIPIAKGTLIRTDMTSVHMDPELWGPEDPQKFYPERHATKRHPMANLGFGVGPRACIAIRFVLIETKLFLVKLLSEYTVLPGEHMEERLKLRETPAIAPEELWVKLVKRDA